MIFKLPSDVDRVVATALAEDLGIPAEGLLGGVVGYEVLEKDVTSSTTVPEEAHFHGVIVARQPCVVCGLPFAARVYEMLAQTTDSGEGGDMFPLVAEGADVAAGTVVAEVEGPARAVLSGERTALNLLMTLSGIATEAALWQRAAGSGLKVLDTRKTLPGLRSASKYAVRVGGAHNHRSGLYDMVLIKDNHLNHAGGVEGAVRMARMAGPELVIEVEADSIEQALEAVSAGADIVMLDNMDDAMLRHAIPEIRQAAVAANHEIEIEASGGIILDRLTVLREIGVDRVSTSALTLAPPADFGLDEVNP